MAAVAMIAEKRQRAIRIGPSILKALLNRVTPLTIWKSIRAKGAQSRSATTRAMISGAPETFSLRFAASHAVATR